MMVGDAGNDAVALKKSNCGVAICSDFSDAMTQQTADAIIENNVHGQANKPLHSILAALDIAHETVHSIKQNLWMSLLYNVAMVLLAGGALLAIGLALNPGICAGIMILQTTFILLNTYRVRHHALPHEKMLKDNHVSPASMDHERKKNIGFGARHEKENRYNKCKVEQSASIKTQPVKLRIKDYYRIF